MDNFIDKIAQKLGSGELIRANTSAEAKEMNRMKEKLEEYETLIQQMRQVHLKNVELLRRMQTTVDALEQLEDGQVEEDQVDGYKVEDLTELKDKLETVKVSVETSTKCLEEMIHTEDVKVFRNVEAVVEEGFEKQEKVMYEENVQIKKKMRGVKPLAIVTLVLVGLQFLAMTTWAINYFFELNLF